jgi:hypothetical protein
LGELRQPIAVIRKRATMRWPLSVSTSQLLLSSTNSARDHPGLELDVAPQVVAVGDVVGVFQDLGLGGVALGPLPFLLELGRELVGILHALDVAARAGIAVPVPGAADAPCRPRSRGVKPCPRRRWSMYMPAKPAPMITASRLAVMALSTSSSPDRGRGWERGLRTAVAAPSPDLSPYRGRGI